MPASRCALCFSMIFAMAASPAKAQIINPFPRATVHEQVAREWTFDDGTSGWTAEKDAAIESAPGTLVVRSRAVDPILNSPEFTLKMRGEDRLTLHVRMKANVESSAQWFWMTDDQRAPREANSRRFQIDGDGEWHEYAVAVPVTGTLQQLRFDPATETGQFEIDRIQIHLRRLHPLEIQQVEIDPDRYIATIKNWSEEPRDCRVGRLQKQLAPGAAETFEGKLRVEHPFEVLTIRAATAGFPTVERTCCLWNADVPGTWHTLADGDVTVQVARDGSGARLFYRKQLVGVLSPLVARDHQPVPLVVTQQDDVIVCQGERQVTLKLQLVDQQLQFSLDVPHACEAPVVRAIGTLEQGLLAGVEHLGHAERSSSNLDLRGPEHVRFQPDPMLLTMPLMAFVTNRGSLSMTWRDMSLQPTFAAPNFYDGTSDHRMSLIGKSIQAVIRIGESFQAGARLEDAVLWSLAQQGGLQPLPERPRSTAEQAELELRCFNESVCHGGENTWFHAVNPGGKKLPETPRHFADIASAVFRLTGTVPQHPQLVPHGGHIRNDAIYFLTGKADVWLDRLRREAQGLRERQQPDGSYRYDGKLRQGHFENTSSGQCSRPAAQLLLHARYTGDAASLQAGLRTLEFMKRFRTPRGASVWECPLHAPDLLASAYAVRAYVLGYELTKKQQYLDLAVRWAVSGIPFVYQWSNRPIMNYATIGTLCATHYQAPVWIGRPVQWMGVVYADCLLDLLPFDNTLDWKRLAEGILVSAQQQQYPDGPSIGCLADSLLLKSQRLLPYDINASAITALRLRCAGEVASLAFIKAGEHRILTPFPATIVNGRAVIEATKGLRYQVVVDGRPVDIESSGTDRISLKR